MKKTFHWLLMGLLCVSAVFASCSETEEVYRYADWQGRNDRFLDSIANVVEQDRTGKWEKLLSYTLSPGNTGQTYAASDYIYVEKLQDAQGENLLTPHFSDSVYVHYRGTLMNGDRFDGSYSTAELDYSIAQPTKFAVGGVVTGFSTALQHMRTADPALEEWQYKGDRWRIYIPYQLAYGSSTSNSAIPAYSVLVFDVALVATWRTGEVEPEWN